MSEGKHNPIAPWGNPHASFQVTPYRLYHHHHHHPQGCPDDGTYERTIVLRGSMVVHPINSAISVQLSWRYIWPLGSRQLGKVADNPLPELPVNVAPSETRGLFEGNGANAPLTDTQVEPTGSSKLHRRGNSYGINVDAGSIQDRTPRDLPPKQGSSLILPQLLLPKKNILNV